MKPNRGAPLALALMLVAFVPATALGATRYVGSNGTDSPTCGLTITTACRSITRAIALAAPLDVISVGPGRYGDLNGNGVLGEPGEENGSPGCGCVVSLNKNVSVISSGGAAVTYIDGTTVSANTTVLLITNGGEFGRVGKGFTVSETSRYDGKFYYPVSSGIVLDAANVTVRGNRVVVARQWLQPGGDSKGIVTVNFAPVRLEGNFVSGWGVGIESRGAAIVSKNQVVGNTWGVVAYGGTVTGNVASFNAYGFGLLGPAIATSNSAVQNGTTGFYVALPFAGSVSKNNIFGTRNSIYGVACGLHNVDVSDLKATSNFWGEGRGPGAVGADTACTSPAAPSTYIVPFATKPFAVTILKP